MTSVSEKKRAREAAKLLMENRLNLIQDLAEARQAQDQAADELEKAKRRYEQQSAAADEQYAEAYAAATKGGWSAGELRGIDYRRPPAKPKSKAASIDQDSPEDSEASA